MFDLRKLFIRESSARPAPADSEYAPSTQPGEGLEVEYQSLIATQFRRWGISPAAVTIEVKQIGRTAEGFDILVGMVRLTRWHRTSALRVLIGFPLLEAKVRKAVRATWLADYSHFGGLWLNAGEAVPAAEGAAELRDLMLKLTPPSPVSSAAGMAQGGGPTGSTLPPGSSVPVTQPSSEAVSG